MADTQADNQVDQRELMVRCSELQVKFWAALQDPAAHWAAQPCVAAHAVAMTLRAVLSAVIVIDPGKITWALELLDFVRAQVVAHAAVATVSPTDRTH